MGTPAIFQLGGENFVGILPNPKNLVNFQESWILDKVESEPAALAEEGTEKGILQVCEDDIHKAAKGTKLLTRTALVQ